MPTNRFHINSFDFFKKILFAQIFLEVLRNPNSDSQHFARLFDKKVLLIDTIFMYWKKINFLLSAIASFKRRQDGVRNGDGGKKLVLLVSFMIFSQNFFIFFQNFELKNLMWCITESCPLYLRFFSIVWCRFKIFIKFQKFHFITHIICKLLSLTIFTHKKIVD